MMLVQGDQPLVTTDMLLALVEAWQGTRPAIPFAA
jgi:CTP:molybdopterin cytidylyltransferase MocA